MTGYYSSIGDIFRDKINTDSDDWTSFKEKLGKEVKGIKWVATTRQLVPKIFELLNIKIPDILLKTWDKAEKLKKQLEESYKNPDETFYLELTDHSIKSEYKPYFEIRINNIPQPKKIEFIIEILFNLKGFELKIQKGKIVEIKTGVCDVEGKLKLEELVLAEKKLEPINLPGIFSISEV